MARLGKCRPSDLALLGVAAYLLAMTSSTVPAAAADLIVSGNDGKFFRDQGSATYPQPAASDSLALIDAAQFPPKVLKVIEGLEHTVAGPPSAVAITPDGALAVLSAPSAYDYVAKKESLGTFLQVIDLVAGKLLGRVELGAHPNGLSISPDGKLLLAACLDGTVKVLTISGRTVTLAQTLKIDPRRLSGVTFTHDGLAALVARRDSQGIAVLDVAPNDQGGVVSLSREMISTGVSPYVIDVSSDGRWAAVGNAGIAGILDAVTPGDADSVTLIDVSKRPFRAVQHLTTPSLPEGVALSPDGKWLVVLALNGSNLRPTDPGPGRQPKGRILLFAIGEAGATKIDELPAGEAGQGVVFAKDSKTILAQFNVDKQLAIFQIQNGRLIDTGRRLPLAAGPVTIRSMPR